MNRVTQTSHVNLVIKILVLNIFLLQISKHLLYLISDKK